MNLYDIELYMDDVHYVCSLEFPWNKLNNKSIMVSGATGLLGSFFIDVILEKNKECGLNCTIYALGRDKKKANERFSEYAHDPYFVFIPYDVRLPLAFDDLKDIDFIIHLASNTHPMQYSTDPVGTITTNIIGLKNMLEYAVVHNTARFVFASSNEVYGENRGDVEFFDESYCGYLNCNTLRAGYPESKRCGEALCQAYISQNGLDVVIPRFTRSYGPTMLLSDTKAISQFLKKGIANENIVLKSSGNQFYSYTYVSDAISGLFTVLFHGDKGEAYNIADEHNDITLKELAGVISSFNGKNVIFEEPSVIESAGYSTATKARLNGNKIRELGWSPQYDIYSGLERCFKILKNLYC